MNKLIIMTLALAASTAAYAAPAPSQAPVAAVAPQTAVLKGTVVDMEGEPLLGATVRVKGTSLAAATNMDGDFTIANVPVGSTIEITYIGYEPITAVWNGSEMNIVLQENATQLQEVVVLGYGVTQKRATVTNSVSKVSEQTLTVGANANPAQALAGAVSGVKVYVTSGSPSATPTIVVRGGTDWGGGGSPVIVVDGVIRASMADINPNDIEDMQILKDAGATALYGARAANGVVLITTKQGKQGTARVTLNAKVGLGYNNEGYEMCTPEEYLYYYRLCIANANPSRAGNDGFHNYATQYNNLFSGNGAGQIGRTSWANNQNFDNMTYRPDLQGAGGNMGNNWVELDGQVINLFDYGWKTMEDPLSNATIMFRDVRPNKINTHTALTQDYNVSIQGGNDRGTYYAGLGYYDADPVMKNTFYKRYNFSFTGSYKIANWLQSNSTFTYTRANWLNDWPQASNLSNGYQAGDYFFNRAQGFYFVRYNTEFGKDLYGTGYPTINSNLNAKNFDRDNQSDKFAMTQSLQATIIKGLTLKGTMSWFYNEELDFSFNRDYYTSQAGAAAGTNQNTQHGTSASFSRYFDRTYNLVANFDRTFAEKHSVNAMLGLEYYHRVYKAFNASGSGADLLYPGLGLTVNNSESQTRGMGSSKYDEAIMSYFGRAEYVYDGKYIAAATFRQDGYSRLIDNRWGFFPGVSAGWVFSKEKFWSENNSLDFINFAKLRASFGMNGVVSSSYIGYYTLQGQYGNVQYMGNKGYYLATLANNSLKWERTRTMEVGLDLGLWQNRIDFRTTYYNRLTMDKYANKTLPYSTGFGNTSLTTNNGKFRNQGVEFDINATLLNLRDFSWNLGFNITYNMNKVVELPDNGIENNRIGGTEVYTGVGDETYYIGGLQEGQEPYHVAGFKHVGMFRNQADLDNAGDYIVTYISNATAAYANEAGRQRLLAMGYSAGSLTRLMPGDFIWGDINGDNQIDNFDKVDLGHQLPHWSGGFNTTFRWKGLQLYARFDMGFDFKVYDSNMCFWLAEGQGSMGYPKQVNDTWTATNVNAKYARLVWADQYVVDNNIRTSTFWTQNGNYLACRELSLSYSLPQSICQKFRSQGLTVSVTGQNLGYLKACTIPLPDNTTFWSGSTAGWGGTYPLPRTVLFGLNVSF